MRMKAKVSSVPYEEFLACFSHPYWQSFLAELHGQYEDIKKGIKSRPIDVQNYLRLFRNCAWSHVNF